MKTGIEVLVAAVIAVLTSVPPAPAQPSPEAPLAPPDVVVEVRGLSCPFCAYGIEKKFVEREEVDSLFVALEEGEVRIWLKPDRNLTDREVRRTVRDAGFTPGEIRRPSSGEGAGSR